MPGLSNWKLLSNYYVTFKLENVNLLSNPDVNPKNGVAFKKMCKSKNSQKHQWGLSEQAHKPLCFKAQKFPIWV